jgi:large subunit ribosomal protein L25
MEQIELSAQSRAEFGKGPTRRLRSTGRVPAVLYGTGIDGSEVMSLDNKELSKVLHTEAGKNVLINLDIDESGKSRLVMFKEIVRHPLKETIQHVDLYVVSMEHKIIVDVPIHLTGKAEGVVLGGLMQQELRQVKVECLPTSIPDAIDCDITALEIGQNLHIGDLVFPEGVSAHDDPAGTIVSIVAPAAETEEKSAEEAEEELTKSFGEEAGDKTEEESKE